MFGIPLGLIVRAALIAMVAIAAAYAVHRYDKHQQDIGYQRGHAEALAIQQAWDSDKAARMAQVAQINQERVDAVNRADTAARDAERARTVAFADVRRSIPAGPVGGPVARRLLNNAVAAANGQPTPSTSEPAPDTASTAEPPDFGPWLRWGEQVAELYSACRQQVIDWNRFYEDLRAPH